MGLNPIETTKLKIMTIETIKLIIGILMVLHIIPFIAMIDALCTNDDYILASYLSGWLVNLILIFIIGFVILILWCFNEL